MSAQKVQAAEGKGGIEWRMHYPLPWRGGPFINTILNEHACALLLAIPFSVYVSNLLQTSPLTVTPLGHGQKCHCNQMALYCVTVSTYFSVYEG